MSGDITGDIRLIPKSPIGPPCKTCGHPKRKEIDRLLVEGESTTKAIALRYGITAQGLGRHRARHLPLAAGTQEAVQAHQEAEGERGASLLDQAVELTAKARAILATATETKQLDTALRAIREVARLLDLSARLTGQIDTSTTVNLTLAPVMVSLQSAIMAALAHHPEARRDVIAALSRMSGPPMIEGNAA